MSGGNGQGKTSLLEAVGWLATLDSFRGAPSDALVRSGAEQAVVRATGSRGGRDLLLEGTIPLRGRTRVQINRQALRRTRDLLGALRVSVFSPDDLVIVKGGPGERRRYLDDLLVACHPKWDGVRVDVERILRQRATLLKQAGGRLSTEIALTLDVWDAKLDSVGTVLAEGRAELTARLGPALTTAYRDLAGPTPAEVGLVYAAPWMSEGLACALGAARTDDVRRGVSTVGPHRDDLMITLNGLPSRTHASQGEQRCLALALRLGGHGVVAAESADEPVLLLDDVFSELDPERSAALLAHLPPGQALLTTAGPLPGGIDPAAVVEVRNGEATTRVAGPR
ncbi:MAG: DNA replication/repair protein RecF [Acidimicrobiales bacterium]